jgi:aspartate carbamoyltransferase catalytic subunit
MGLKECFFLKHCFPGDGTGEHPTQALLDSYTIFEELGTLNGLTGFFQPFGLSMRAFLKIFNFQCLLVTMVGDLKHGRTVHSLARLLLLFHVRFNFVSPKELSMPSYILEELKRKGAEYKESEDLLSVIAETDVLYVTRVQKERFAREEEYNLLKDAFIITPQVFFFSFCFVCRLIFFFYFP